MGNSEWRYVRDNYPEQWDQACRLDEEIRAEDQAQGHAGVWLHVSRKPLRSAPIDDDDGRDAKIEGRQCGLGMCFV
jgi:predicted metalloprotease